MWQRALAAAVCGLYPAVISHTKLAISDGVWNSPSLEVWAFLFPCIIALIMLSAANISPKRSVARHLTAILLSLTIVAAMIAHEHMIAVAAAAVATLVFAKLFLKREPAPIRTFLISLILFGTGAYYLSGHLSSHIPFYAPNFDFMTHVRAYSPDMDLLRLISGNLYYFAVSTWGLGILALPLFAKNAREYTVRIKHEKQHSSANSEAAAESCKQAKLLIFSAFAMLSLLFSLGLGVLNSLESLMLGAHREFQDVLLNGTHIDNIVPLVLLSAICVIFIRGLELRGILYSTVILGIVFSVFFSLTSSMVVNAVSVTAAPILGLYPIRIGVDIGSLITFDGLFLTVSAVFSFMALLIVYVSCGQRFRTNIIAGTIAAISLYSAIYVCAVYLPYQHEQLRGESQAVQEESEPPPSEGAIYE
jgi:hypothetical protein